MNKKLRRLLKKVKKQITPHDPFQSKDNNVIINLEHYDDLSPELKQQMSLQFLHELERLYKFIDIPQEGDVCFDRNSALGLMVLAIRYLELESNKHTLKDLLTR